ncbi:hypothetical protein OROHE_013024 [Orobanche hederae]
MRNPQHSRFCSLLNFKWPLKETSDTHPISKGVHMSIHIGEEEEIPIQHASDPAPSSPPKTLVAGSLLPETLTTEDLQNIKVPLTKGHPSILGPIPAYDPDQLGPAYGSDNDAQHAIIEVLQDRGVKIFLTRNQADSWNDECNIIQENRWYAIGKNRVFPARPAETKQILEASNSKVKYGKNSDEKGTGHANPKPHGMNSHGGHGCGSRRRGRSHGGSSNIVRREELLAPRNEMTPNVRLLPLVYKLSCKQIFYGQLEEILRFRRIGNSLYR